MRSIEKTLTSYVRGNGQRLSNEMISTLTEQDANGFINTLFMVINKELDVLEDKNSLIKIRELLNYIYMVLGTSTNVNRKIISRKLNRLEQKIDRIQMEKRKKWRTKSNIKKEFQQMEDEIDRIQTHTEEKETKQYDFIKFLIEEVHNINYIEYTLNKIPSLVNIKDKDNNPLIYNVVNNYLNSLENAEEEDIFYYTNLISLILSMKSFHMTEIEKRKVLENVYSFIDKENLKKGKNKKALSNELKDLVEKIKTCSDKAIKMEEIAKKYNIAIQFPESILEKIQKLDISQTSDLDRRKIEDYIITIDGEGAIEIDDALSCKKLPNGNYLLGVHIASALSYFPYHSEIVEEAIQRNKSIYLPKKYQEKENDFNKVIPIFPYDFSANKGSLLEQVPRLARSYYYEIAKDGTVVDEVFLKTIIMSSKKTTYREIDKVLDHGSKDERLQELVNNLREVTEILDKKYQPSSLYEQVKENTDDFSDLRVKRVGAEKIVYQAMLLNGNRVANYFAAPERNYPCLYRVHSVNAEDSKKLQAMIDNLTKTYGGSQYEKLYQLINGLYPKGWYAMSGSHDGLGIDHYCHCTSTLRRAADIVVEHALDVCYDKNPSDKELKELEEEISKRASEINARQDPIEWFVRDYKRAYQKRR